MSVLFLDIDGVLITHNSTTTHHADPACIAALQKVIKEVNPDIVITSDWRTIHNIDLNKTLSNFGLQDFNLVGSTPYMNSFRGAEIGEWMNEHGRPDHFAIIDDLDDMGELRSHLVQTNFKTGLTFDHADRIIRLLRK